MAIPAAEVVQAEGWKETLVFGFDGSHAAFEAIRSGGLKATILQDPLEQGKKAVETMASHLRGQHLDPEIITPLRLVTRSNVDQFQPGVVEQWSVTRGQLRRKRRILFSDKCRLTCSVENP